MLKYLEWMGLASLTFLVLFIWAMAIAAFIQIFGDNE